MILAACADSVDQKTLALACQTEPCTCTDASPPLFGPADTTAILWRKNGDAYCPKNYKLQRTGE